MIVRDEARVIERCLRSVEGLIDSWVICDTGSRDGTQQLVERLLAGVPGQLYENRWTNFGHNRTELMRVAVGRADYLLLLDADMTVTFNPAGLTGLTADCYLLRHAGSVEYWITRLVRGDRTWRYVGSTHEHVATDGRDAVQKLDAIVIHHHADGGSRAAKFDRDLRLLSEDLRADPADARAAFYLAQTYRDMGRRDEAIELYQRRAEMGGWDQEIFYSMFQAAVLRADNGDWPAAMAALNAAWEFRPTRLEPVYELASRLRVRGEYRAAHHFACRGVDQPQPDDVLYVWPWVYRWGLLFEYSITAYWVGQHQQALAACRRLLSLDDLPAEYRAHVLKNMDFCLRRIRPTPPTGPRAPRAAGKRLRSR